MAIPEISKKIRRSDLKPKPLYPEFRAPLDTGPGNDPGRNAYLTAFHTAQAFQT